MDTAKWFTAVEKACANTGFGDAFFTRFGVETPLKPTTWSASCATLALTSQKAWPVLCAGCLAILRDVKDILCDFTTTFVDSDEEDPEVDNGYIDPNDVLKKLEKMFQQLRIVVSAWLGDTEDLKVISHTELRNIKFTLCTVLKTTMPVELVNAVNETIDDFDVICFSNMNGQMH